VNQQYLCKITWFELILLMDGPKVTFFFFSDKHTLKEYWKEGDWFS